MIKNATTEDMKTMTECLSKLVSDGYKEDFKALDKGLKSMQSEKTFAPHQIHVVNYYRFEGASDPADNSILYAIETTDGSMGTLVDAFGPYADVKVNKFMQDVEEIAKKNTVTEEDTKN